MSIVKECMEDVGGKPASTFNMAYQVQTEYTRHVVKCRVCITIESDTKSTNNS